MHGDFTRKIILFSSCSDIDFSSYFVGSDLISMHRTSNVKRQDLTVSLKKSGI